MNLTGGNHFRKEGKWVQEALINAICSEYSGIYPSLSGENKDKQIIFDFVTTPYELGGL